MLKMDSLKLIQILKQHIVKLINTRKLPKILFGDQFIIRLKLIQIFLDNKLNNKKLIEIMVLILDHKVVFSKKRKNVKVKDYCNLKDLLKQDGENDKI